MNAPSLTMAGKVRAECKRRYAEARRKHRRSAAELKALQKAAEAELRLCVRIRRNSVAGIFSRAVAALGLGRAA